MEYLHTMVRVKNIEESLDFYCDKLGLIEFSRKEVKSGRFTLVFLCAPDDKNLAEKNKKPLLELTYNWDAEEYKGGRNFGHLAFSVNNIYEKCQFLMDNGVTINRPPKINITTIIGASQSFLRILRKFHSSFKNSIALII